MSRDIRDMRDVQLSDSLDPCDPSDMRDMRIDYQKKPKNACHACQNCSGGGVNKKLEGKNHTTNGKSRTLGQAGQNFHFFAIDQQI